MKTVIESTLDEYIPFEGYIANLQSWRECRCNKLLAIINDMMQSELHRIKSQ